VGVAVEVDGDGEGGDVGGEALDVDRERRLGAAVAGRAYSGGVDPVEQLPLELRKLGLWVGLARGARERLLG
jgi:hypothetical protein